MKTNAAYVEDEVNFWPATAERIKAKLEHLGVAGAEVVVYSAKEDAARERHAILLSELFATVVLTMEQVDLLLAHARPGAGTDTLFAMAQAIESGLDIGYLFDPATGRLLVPHAARKGEVLA